MSNRKIISRKYYTINVELLSPLNIGGQEGDTDSDVMRNGTGECFVPGTSLAGAFRNYLGVEKKNKSAYGFSDGENGQMSSIFISDLYFDDDTVNFSIRDRVQLKQDKEVENKFDVEIIEPGAKGCIRIETVTREEDEPLEGIVSNLIVAIQEGDIRIGANKNRGFGRLNVISVATREFDANNRKDWIEYLSANQNDCGEKIPYTEWAVNKSKPEMKYEKFSVPLKLCGGISIRKYSAKPGKADYEHITSNGEPVIPGNSWNGAIRSDAKSILMELGLNESKASKLIEDWFGVANAKSADSWQSRIVFSESVIKGAKAVPMTRNNINSFTSVTKDGALYSEISYFGGTTELNYMIDTNPKLSERTSALKGMMELVTKDLENGIISVGGQVAIGRGVFERNADVVKEDEVSNHNLQALYHLIEKTEKEL